MKSAIVARRSVRSYTGQPLRASLIDGLAEFIAQIQPLHDNIPVDIELYDRKEFAADFARVAPYRGTDFAVIRSAVNVGGYLQNAGFIGEQIILWLTHVGVGSCWVGLVRPKNPPARGELPYVIAIEFGRANNAPFRRQPEDSPRKKLHEVVLNKVCRPEYLPMLEAARLAPSPINEQPVRYWTDNDGIHLCRQTLPVRIKKLEEAEQIAVGAAMANMYVQCGGHCEFVRRDSPPQLPQNCIYEYTVILK